MINCQRIRELRETHEEPYVNGRPLTQSYLAFFSGVSQATICYIESDPSYNVSLRTMLKIAEYFDVDINELIVYRSVKRG